MASMAASLVHLAAQMFAEWRPLRHHTTEVCIPGTRLTSTTDRRFCLGQLRYAEINKDFTKGFGLIEMVAMILPILMDDTHDATIRSS